MTAINKFLLLVLLGFFPSRLAAQSSIYALPIHSATQAVAAVAAGDFDPLHAGDEIACLLGNGSVIELALAPSGWTTSTIFTYTGTPVPFHPAMRVTLNVGDVLPQRPGKELALSFQQQVVAVYHLAGPGWTNQIIADFKDYVATTWGAEAGDCDPAHPGDEVFSIVEGVLDFSVGTVYGETNGTWPENLVYSAEVGMDAAVDDSNPDVAGKEIILVTEMGPAYEITPPSKGGPGPWPRRTIWDDFDNAGWVVKIGDVDPASPGNEIVYGTRYTDRLMLSHHNGTNMHNVNILLTGVNTNPQNSMLDVAIGQLFRRSPSREVLGVDMSGSVYVAEKVNNQWVGSVLWRDTNALYAALAADLIPTPGDEVVVAGASGTVTLLCDPSPVLNLGVSPQQAILSWTALRGLTYQVEATTSLTSNPSWTQLANLVYEGAFSGPLSYTNAGASTAQFFRVKASR